MRKATQQERQAALDNQARDVMGPRPPDVSRRLTLSMGGTQEEADQAALSVEMENEERGFGTWEEYEKAMTAGMPMQGRPPQRAAAKAS